MIEARVRIVHAGGDASKGGRIGDELGVLGTTVVNAMQRFLALSALCALTLGACRGPEKHSPEPPIIERASMTQVRAILVDGERVGSVASYRALRGQRRGVQVIRNAHGQDLGLIDIHGVVWRYLPHGDAQPVAEADRLRALAVVLELSEEIEVTLGPPEPVPQEDPPRP